MECLRFPSTHTTTLTWLRKAQSRLVLGKHSKASESTDKQPPQGKILGQSLPNTGRLHSWISVCLASVSFLSHLFHISCLSYLHLSWVEVSELTTDCCHDLPPGPPSTSPSSCQTVLQLLQPSEVSDTQLRVPGALGQQLRAPVLSNSGFTASLCCHLL